MLSLQNVSKTFNRGSVNERPAVHDLSLELGRGEVVTVIGGNGAGKSTLLNLITGVCRPDAGHIRLDGSPVENLPEHVRAAFIGRVFQDPLMGTAAYMTIEENLAIAMRRGQRRTLGRGVRRQDRGFYREQLEMLGLGLENRLATRVGLLSGGQRQALTLLMATLVPPKILLLDEHTAALDPQTAPKVLALTLRFIEQHRLTTIMVTHNLQDALRVGNRTIMMHEGRIIMDLQGTERGTLQVADIMEMFRQASGTALDNDRLLLSN